MEEDYIFGPAMHWYDRIYDPCKHSNGYSAPEVFYGSGKSTPNGCETQHKTFSYVDYRSGREVRLYGIVDRYSSGSDADFIISQIVGDLLPFDRTTDHILNNDPSDREIYCLLEEVLRKICKAEMNGSNGSIRSLLGTDSLGSSGSFGSRFENNGTLQNSPYGNYGRSSNGINSPNSGPLNPQISDKIARKLSVMEFLDFYKDIIERVDEAANAEERKYMACAGINQVNIISPPLNPYNEHISPSSPQPAQYEDPANVYAFVEADSTFNHSSPHPSKKKFGMMNRKVITRNTTLPSISESAEKWWTEEGEYPKSPEEQHNFNFPDNTVIPQSIPSPFQPASVTYPVEAKCSSDDEEFLREIEKVAIDLGYAENGCNKETGETTSIKSDDKFSFMDSSSFGDTNIPCTAATIVYIYGNKMFVGSIGDSRVILLRQKCHYMDVMYLNEPPLAWCPIAAAKNSYFKNKRHILFQEPIVRGGFLLNEYSVFLLMFNDGVIANILKMNDYHHTSNEINRIAVQMVIKILEKCPPTNIAQKFVAHIKHSCNRKYKDADASSGVKREGMSFLFADLRQLVPPKQENDNLPKSNQTQPNLSDSAPVQPYPLMMDYSCPSKNEEKLQNITSLDKVYDLFQQMFSRHDSVRSVNSTSIINEDTWVFLRSDQNDT